MRLRRCHGLAVDQDASDQMRQAANRASEATDSPGRAGTSRGGHPRRNPIFGSDARRQPVADQRRVRRRCVQSPLPSMADMLWPHHVHHRPHALSRQVRRDWPGQGSCTHDGSVPRRCRRTCLRQHVRDPSSAKVFQVQEGRCRSGLGTGQRGRVGLPQLPHRGTHLELAGQSLGPAKPPADIRLTNGGSGEAVVEAIPAVR